MNKEIENYEKLILELTDLDIQTNGRLNEIQRIQLELYSKIYLLLKLNNNLKEENKLLKAEKKSLLNTHYGIGVVNNE